MATYYMRADGTAAFKTITGCANNGSGLIRVTSAGHGLTDGMEIAIGGVVGTTEANGNWVVCNDETNTFDLTGSTFANAYTSGGKAIRSDPDAAASAMSVATHNASTFSAGDIIYLSSQGGTYTTKLTIPSSGSGGSYITYDAVNGESPAFDMSKDVTGWVDDGGGVYHAVVADAGTIYLMDAGEFLEKTTGATPAEGKWSVSTTTVYYHPVGGGPPSATTKRLTNDNAQCVSFSLVNKTYIKIQNIQASHGVIFVYLYSSGTPGIDHITVNNCTVDRYPFMVLGQVATDKYSTNITVTNNTANYVSLPASFGNASGSEPVGTQYHGYFTITGNTITNVGYAGPSLLSYTQVYGSAVDQEAISFQDVNNALIENNTIVDGASAAVGIYLYGTAGGTAKTEDNIIRNNYVRVNNIGLYFTGNTGCAGFENNLIYNNILNACGVNGLTCAVYIAVPNNPLEGINYIYNNNIYNGTTTGFYIHDNTSGYWHIKNNIINGTTCNILKLTAGACDYTLDYNIYPNIDTRWYDGGWKSWATWTGTYDSNSALGDPLFINGSGSYNTANDFKLQATSPAKGTGTDVDVDTDINGFTHVPTTAPSIGAHSFGHTQRVRHYRR